MPTKAYSVKYRKLKQLYESITGKTIVDVTWTRLLMNLRKYFSLSDIEASNAQSIIETYARLKKQCPAFSFKVSSFDRRWQAFKHFYDSPSVNRDGEESLAALTHFLGVRLEDVPRSTRYYWFTQAGLKYKVRGIFHGKDLALVAFVATQWAINKREGSTMKSANPDDNDLAA